VWFASWQTILSIVERRSAAYGVASSEQGCGLAPRFQSGTGIAEAGEEKGTAEGKPSRKQFLLSGP
jgi:hypothetical protein